MIELNFSLAILLFIVGLGLVLYFSEKLVEATVGTSLNFGISTFLISVIFIGFDPENLAVGAVASFDGAAGIALGTVFGSAMVAIALAFGITALIAPMEFEYVPVKILFIPVLSLILILILSLDGLLSRADGVLLLCGYFGGIYYLFKISRQGIEIEPSGELKESLEDADNFTGKQSLGWLILSLLGIILGSELLVNSAEYILSIWNVSDTVFGMTLLAFVISIEELGRELPAALKGRPEISYGNVVGSILAFFLFNAGIIAVIQPVPVNNQVQTFYLPICLATVLFSALMMYRNTIPRWAGAILLAGYLVFFIGGFF